MVREDLQSWGNVQVLSAPDDGWPLWVSDVRAGREHDSTALRASGALPIIQDEWTTDLHEVLFDLGYKGLGNPAGPLSIAYKKPKGATLTDEQKAHNRIHNALHAVANARTPRSKSPSACSTTSRSAPGRSDSSRKPPSPSSISDTAEPHDPQHHNTQLMPHKARPRLLRRCPRIGAHLGIY
jgi:hypothetical protein